MTYEEAGELFGLSAEAVRKRARRMHWRVENKGNEPNAKARVLVPDGAELRPTGHPAGRPAGDRDELLAETRRRAEAAEARAAAAEDRLAEARERAGRAEGEAAARRDAEARERERADAERQARERVEAERDAARGELAMWTAGGPLARAVRAFLNRLGRP